MDSYLHSLGSSPGALGFGLYGVAAAASRECAAMIDSGADVHVLSYKDAMKLFQEIRASHLKVVGVNGASTTADVQGRLVITVEGNSGKLHRFDLGTAHGMRGCPMNLLSLSLLLDIGSVIHFEKGDCWIQPPSAHDDAGETERIPLQRVGGLFHLPISKFIHSSFKGDTLTSGLLSADESESLSAGMFAGSAGPYDNHLLHSCSIKGHSFLSGDLELWHRRMRHVSKKKLKKIWSQGLVDGFHMVGNKNENCSCDVCAQAKIQAQGSARVAAYPNRPKVIGEHVSSDVKSLSYVSFEGYNYVINFVDHYSRLGMCFMMRKKSEAAACFQRYCNELAFYGFRVQHLHSDRGSEYFSQEGEIKANHGDRALAILDQFCQAQRPVIKHQLTPVGAKEKIAEVWFKEHFATADAMLWDARLSPAFWADAILFSQFLYNLMPNDHTGPRTPWEMLTGRRARWDKLRVFGSDCYQLIPNDSLAKIPGVVKGKKVIFVGFTPNLNGYRVFDPEKRKYSTVDNIYFYEDFKHRIDSLRHHDKRRDLMMKGELQPVQLDDFADDIAAQGVRNLYTSPDLSEVCSEENDLSAGRNPTTGAASEDDELADRAHDRSTDESRSAPLKDSGPLSPQSSAADNSRKILRSSEVLRPVRLVPVSKEVPWTLADAEFMEHAKKFNIPVSFIPNPKRRGTHSHRSYEKYSKAETIREALELGASTADIRWDYSRAFIRFPKHESDEPGHIYSALEVAQSHGHTHILEDVGKFVTEEIFADHMLAKAFTSQRLENAKYVFNDLLKNVYDPEALPKVLATQASAQEFAESAFNKVLNAQSGVNIDFSLAAEPTKWEQTLPEVCSESEKWKEAMDDEITSMTKFGVYQRLPKSAAGNRQILGCRWVYKRKTNKFGEVYRYRARLVAQGFRQREYDSYDPDKTFSPVIHKDTLRLFLSVSAADNLKVFQADVKAAFLQAPLDEEIFVHAPPGYQEVDAKTGEPIVWKLSKAIYGLKQSSACFWSSMCKHLQENGFESILGDPCLFRKKMADGGIILVATYVDDVTFSTTNPSGHAYFMDMLRSRFEVPEGEGAEIEWLLGMAITQDIAAGTIRMDMETAITKLAEGLLTKEEIAKAGAVSHPMLSTARLLKLQEREVSNSEFDYLSVVGSLLHIANCVRCDVSLAVGILARHGMNPGKAHVRACKRVVMYLYNTRKLGITYRRMSSTGEKNSPTMFEGACHPLDNGSNKLQIFADSDYAADETRRSTHGTVIIMNGGPIAWSSTLGKTVATSTCEAEVNAAVAAAKDALHINRLLLDLKLIEKVPMQIAEDNSACIAQANSGLRHVRNAKHYEVKLAFLQQLVVDHEVEFVYCPTDQQTADFFTKPLDEEKFRNFRGRLLS